ncbi:MAG: hypothetical protein APR54_05760 [Candidatus Cloacimonas sp. SDB]|nr:MAG: hypothetical protein APR54_05760 [Candidatus Cloacimonas sp. SDB]
MKRVIIWLILLMLLLLVISLVYRKSADVTYDLILKIENREFEIADITAFESIEITTNRSDTYTAYSLREILSAKEIQPNKFSRIIFHSADGGSLAVDISELDNLYLVQEIQAGEKSLRLIIPTDDFSQRWLKYLIAIEFIYA